MANVVVQKVVVKTTPSTTVGTATDVIADDALPGFTSPDTLSIGRTAYAVGSFAYRSGGISGAADTEYSPKMRTYANGPDTSQAGRYDAGLTMSVVVPASEESYLDIYHHTPSSDGIPRGAVVYPARATQYTEGGAYWARVGSDSLPGFGGTNVLLPASPYPNGSDGQPLKWYQYGGEEDFFEGGFASPMLSGSYHPVTGEGGPHTIVHYREPGWSLNDNGGRGIEFLLLWYAPDPTAGFPGALIRYIRRPGQTEWTLWFRTTVGTISHAQRWNFQSGVHSTATPPAANLTGHTRIYGMKAWQQIAGSRPAATTHVRFPTDLGHITGNQQTQSGPHTRSMTFKVTENSTITGVMWFSPDTQQITGQLYNGSTLLRTSPTVTGELGWVNLRFASPVTVTAGSELTVQVAMTTGNGIHTALVPPEPTWTVGPFTTVGVTNPFRYGSDVSAVSATPGTSWCGIGIMADATTPVAWPLTTAQTFPDTIQAIFPDDEGRGTGSNRWKLGTSQTATATTGGSTSGSAFTTTAPVYITHVYFYAPVAGVKLTAGLFEGSVQRAFSTTNDYVTVLGDNYIPLTVAYQVQTGVVYTAQVHQAFESGNAVQNAHTYHVVSNAWTATPLPVLGPLTVAGITSPGRFRLSSTAGVVADQTSNSYRRVGPVAAMAIEHTTMPLKENVTPNDSTPGGGSSYVVEMKDDSTPNDQMSRTYVDAMTSVTTTLVTSWNVRSSVTKTLSTNWAVQNYSKVNTMLSTTWGVRTAVTKTLASSWNVQYRVNKTLATSWDVQVSGVVNKSLSTSWNVRASVTRTLASSWKVRTRVNKTVATSWAIEAPAAGSVTWFIWNGTAQVPATLQGVWNGTAIVAATVSVIL
jgi:hypothetical protein